MIKVWILNDPLPEPYCTECVCMPFKSLPMQIDNNLDNICLVCPFGHSWNCWYLGTNTFL